MIQKENIVDQFINLVFPNVCGICGKLNNNYLCKRCEITLRKEKETILEQFYQKNYKELLSFFRYEGIIRNHILNYKFHEKPYMAKTFIKFLLQDENIFKIIKSYDIIVPVPISKERNKERGYNQSLLLAKELNKYVNLTLITNCLYKNKNVIEQSKLGKEERLNNIYNVYQIRNKQILEDKKILVIDDIYTTGSTVNECSRMLKKANPEKIGIMVLAKSYK